MRGFPNARLAGWSTNTYHLDKNCYYCTAAALMNKDVEQLMQVTEIMQQDNGTAEELCELMRDDGADAFWEGPLSEAQVLGFLNNLPNGESIGLGFPWLNGGGHWIVAVRDDGYVNNFVNPGIKLVDFQQHPPAVRGWPMPGVVPDQYVVIYQRETEPMDTTD